MNIVLKVAAKALIINDEGKVLLVREACYSEGTNTGRYQCPGGRLNAGEAYKDGLLREVKEETGLDVEMLNAIHVDEWRPVIKTIPHQIIGVFTTCKALTTTIQLSNEHDSYIWVDPLNIPALNILGADKNALESYAQQLRGARSVAAMPYLCKITQKQLPKFKQL